MIYTDPYIMFLMRADSLQGQVGGGWALEIETFLGPVKLYRAVRRVPFGAKKSLVHKYVNVLCFQQFHFLCHSSLAGWSLTL
jgi:hypothetical protein